MRSELADRVGNIARSASSLGLPLALVVSKTDVTVTIHCKAAEDFQRVLGLADQRGMEVRPSEVGLTLIQSLGDGSA